MQLDEMFSTNLQQSRSFGSSFKFPEGEGGAAGGGAAQFGQDNEE
jgi:transitional endoplasmic reticulum ATPase